MCITHGAKKLVYICSFEGCLNQVVRGGVCITHGAKVTYKRCSFEGCTKLAQKGGVCITHGARVTRKRCNHEGCTNRVQKGGVCVTHGAKVKRCSHVTTMSLREEFVSRTAQRWRGNDAAMRGVTTMFERVAFVLRIVRSKYESNVASKDVPTLS